jgi:hypothetical protein
MVVSIRRVPQAAVRDNIESLFQPDTIAPAEYFDGFKEDAFRTGANSCWRCSKTPCCASKALKSTREKERRLFTDAENWLFGDDRDWALTFLNVFDQLGLEPGILRKGLSHWKLKTLGTELSTGTRLLNESIEMKQDDNRGRKEKRKANRQRRHPRGRQPKLVGRRRTRAAAG